jgi:hypothetical protein
LEFAETSGPIFCRKGAIQETEDTMAGIGELFRMGSIGGQALPR